MFFAAQRDCGGGLGGRALLYNLNGLTSLNRTFLCEDVAEVVIKVLKYSANTSPFVSNLQYLTCMAVNIYQRTCSTWLRFYSHITFLCISKLLPFFVF